jgi:hypothetical protein
MAIAIRLSTLRRCLLSIVGLLILCGFGAEALDATLGREAPGAVVGFFGLSYEGNLPTWASTCLLFSCALLLTLIAVGKRQAGAVYRRHWQVLAIAFLYISLDEFVRIHDFGWVIPAGLVVSMFAIAYAPFLRDLPRRCRNQFMLAAAVYVGGALGVELLLGYWTDLAGHDNFIYGMIDLVEESMELAGASLFLYALTEYLGGPAGVLEISLDATSEAVESHPTGERAAANAPGEAAVGVATS